MMKCVLSRRTTLTTLTIALLTGIILAGSNPAALAAGSPTYTFTDLGTLGGKASLAYRINNQGHVVGEASTWVNKLHAFLDNGSKMEDLTPSLFSNRFSAGYGINDYDEVAFTTYLPMNADPQAFVWVEGRAINLGSLGGSQSEAFAINNAGQITGDSQLKSDTGYHAYLFQKGKMKDLGTLGGHLSTGQGINSYGQVAGFAFLPGDSIFHAFFYDGITMHDLGTLGGHWSYAYAINNHSQITGYSYLKGDNRLHAFLYSNGKMNDLGPEFSMGRAINNNGDVVGNMIVGGVAHAFLYTAGKIYDLNSLIPAHSRIVLNVAFDINDHDWITGYGTVNGALHAFLLKPIGK